MRMFGTEDFPVVLSHFGFVSANSLDLFSREEFVKASVPVQEQKTIGADTVFVQRPWQ